MSNGNVHDGTTVGLAIIASAVVWYYYGMAPGIIVGLGCLFGGLMLSPDLDIRSNPYNRWFLLKFIWWPYQTMGHRNWLSHSLIIGTIGRVCYLLVWVELCLIWFVPWQVQWQWVQLRWEWVIWGLVGIEGAAALHLLLDWVG